MAVEISPRWDPTGTVSLTLDTRCGELEVRTADGPIRFALRSARPATLGWAEQRPGPGTTCWARVSVAHVVCHCLRELEAEEAVIALTRRAAERAANRGGEWEAPARRLRRQCARARGHRVSALPFQTWFVHLARESGADGHLPVTAALRAGYRQPDGRPDTVRLMRRLGLAGHYRRGAPVRNRTVNYATGLDLCRALDRDPAELGL